MEETTRLYQVNTLHILRDNRAVTSTSVSNAVLVIEKKLKTSVAVDSPAIDIGVL